MSSLKIGDAVNFVLPHKTIEGEVVRNMSMFFVDSGHQIFKELGLDAEEFVEKITGVNPRKNGGSWPYHEDIGLDKIQKIINALHVEITKKYYSDVKVGDTVECLPTMGQKGGNVGNDMSQTGNGFEPGRQFVVRSIHNDCALPCYFPARGSGVYAHAVRKVEAVPEEIDLEEVKRRYPLGTIVDCVYGNGKGKGVVDYNVVDTAYTKGVLTGENTWLLLNGKWAKKHAQDPEEDLIEEAKRRYPVGTKFFPAHLKWHEENTEYCVITEDTEILQHGDNNIAGFVNGKSWLDCSPYGNGCYNRMLYNNGTWAKVLETPQTTQSRKGVYVNMDHIDALVGGVAEIANSRKSSCKTKPVTMWREPKQVEHTRARQINLIKVKQITLK